MEPNTSQGCLATYARFVGILNNHFLQIYSREKSMSSWAAYEIEQVSDSHEYEYWRESRLKSVT